MIDDLRKRRAELARRIEVLDGVTAFVDALSAECGIAAEVETDDGDVIVCIPQIVPREPVAVSERPAGERQEPLPTADEPQTAAKPAPTARQAKAAKGTADRNGLPWEAHEDDEIVRRRVAGQAIGAIAAALGRTYAATDLRARKVLADRIKAARTATCAPPAPAHVSETPKPEPVARVVSAPATRPLPEPHGTPGWLRELNALGHVAPWTPALDLRLAEGLGAGRKLADLAPVLGVTPEQARGRWKALMPDLGIEAQQRTLDELRARAAAVPQAAE